MHLEKGIKGRGLLGTAHGKDVGGGGWGGLFGIHKLSTKKKALDMLAFIFICNVISGNMMIPIEIILLSILQAASN